MGKIGGSSWLNIVRKAFGSPVKDKDKNEKKICSKRREEPEPEQEHEEEEKKRGKRRWIFRKPLSYETTIQHNENEARTIILTSNASSNNMLRGNLVKKPTSRDAMSPQQCAIVVAMATKVAAEAAVATAQAAAEIIRLTRPAIPAREEHAAIIIQTAFRGCLARRALRALKGLVMLQALVRGYNVRKRAKMTLQCMQALIRLQAQACDQRKRLSIEGCSSSDTNCTWESLTRGKKFESRNAIRSDNDDDQYTPRKKIHDQQQKTNNTASKPEMSLYQAFSQQMWKAGKAQMSADNKEYEANPEYYECFNRRKSKQWKGIGRTSFDEKEPIKIVEIDTVQNSRTSQAHNYQDYQQRPSSYTASSPLRRIQNFSIQPLVPRSPGRLKPVEVQSTSPRFQRAEKYSSAPQTTNSNYFDTNTVCRNSVPTPQPKYMAATASASARARSLSTPRQRSSTPQSPKKGTAKKRLSFTASEPHHDVNPSSLSWHHSFENPGFMYNDDCVQDEQRSYMSS